MKLIFFVFAILFLFSPFFRALVKNIHFVPYYSFYDLYHYFKDKKYKEYNEFGITMYINMFGAGKTLSMTRKASMLYAKYGNNLRFISNYHLTNIPYIPLINFKQLLDLGTMEDDDKIGTVVLIDEISTVLSHRNFSNFPLELLSVLLQQRKRKIVILCTAQRFFMVDKIWRSITTNVISCKKYWRFVRLSTFDAWEYEQAINTNLIKPLGKRWYFVRNKDFMAYDTSEMISKQSAEDFISNEEAIVRKGLDSQVSNINNLDKRSLSRSGRNRTK